ncbi:MAG TPA: PKD domain-containing protein, partial [Candidatus Nanoarchaeia archaeon]|nr:PKD domain-containing protein [Candidatus Nanoarchaeia archaeon]
KKRVVLILLMLFFIAYSVNAFDLKLELTKTNYGRDQNFAGNLIIMGNESLDLDKMFFSDTNDEQNNISIKDWLNNSKLDYNKTDLLYLLKDSGWNSKLILTGNGEALVGFSVPVSINNIRDVSIGLNGKGNVKVDLDDDGIVDWSYKGEQTGYGSEIYKESYNANTIADSEAAIVGNKQFSRCQEMELGLNNLFNESRLKINLMVKKVSDGGKLNVSINDKECGIDDSSLNNNEFKKVSCEIELDNPENGVYDICAYSKAGSGSTIYYMLPRKNDFYFITVQEAKYNESLNGQTFISGIKIVDILQNKLNSCSTNECILPIKVILTGNGESTINNILLQDEDFINYNRMYFLNKLGEQINIADKFSLPLNGFNELRTASANGSYNLQISLENVNSNSVVYNVTETSGITINVSKSIAAINEEINFNVISLGNWSSYLWDFGDGKNGTGKNVKHKYNLTGNYTTKVKVKDDNNLEGSATTIVRIGNIEDNFKDLIDDIKKDVNSAKKSYTTSSSNIKEAYQILGYDILLNNAINNLTILENEFNNVKTITSSVEREKKLNELIKKLNEVKSSVVTDVIVDTIEIDNLLLDYERIPSSFGDKDQIYSFNAENVKVDVKSRLINAYYLDGKENKFKLITKNVKLIGEGNSKTLIEDLSNVAKKAEDVNILTLGSKKDGLMYKWDIINEKKIEYTLQGNDVNEYGNTIVLGELLQQDFCGDGICQENEACPSDCGKKPTLPFIIIAVVVLIGIFYINFYKGKGNYRDLGNWLSVKLRKKRLFTNQQDLDNLQNYVTMIVNRGFNQEGVRRLLKKQGWTEEQVEYAFKHVKKKEKL